MMAGTVIPGVDVVVERDEWAPANPYPTTPVYIPGQVDHGRAHYTAARNLPDGDPGETLDDVLTLIANIHRTTPHGVAYNFVVDWTGRAIVGRGFDYRNAANNGDKPIAYRDSTYQEINLNRHTFSVLFLVDGADPLTDAMLATGNALFAEARRRSLEAGSVWVAPYVRPHSESDYTLCCGDGIRGNIDRQELDGTLPPPPPSPPPPIEEDTYMRNVTYFRVEGTANVFATGPNGTNWVQSAADLERYRQDTTNAGGDATIHVIEKADMVARRLVGQSGIHPLDMALIKQ